MFCLKVFRNSTLLVSGLLAILFTHNALADAKPYQDFGDYRVIYTVFNSSFIKPDIAKTYNITRGKSQALINVSLIKNTADGSTEGLPANISGTVTNLMQQQKVLKFVEVQEQNAVYYLAPLRFTNEEVLNFAIEVKTSANAKPFELEFTKTLYVDK
ncbi:DUF4426 domain-containing protein [Maricurvus nonylphenolicus]|uniref:DUF4426 domain-containing protein n=1 Tax=Maricurvus nonylphenolicus TaxID=1008307 RepID=UPI0036F24E40